MGALETVMAHGPAARPRTLPDPLAPVALRYQAGCEMVVGVEAPVLWASPGPHAAASGALRRHISRAAYAMQ